LFSIIFVDYDCDVMAVKTQFSIKDLENLSGVKAHTIRIWEKRYSLLEPERTDTNIRQYDLINLKQLLNVTFLYNNGYKISKIAKLSEAEMHKLINSLGEHEKEDHSLKAFKTAMFEFDQLLFQTTYNGLAKKMSFENIFFEIFIPLLGEVGRLWHTGTIDPIHERFVSELIKHKIIENIQALRNKFSESNTPKFALFLPKEEIHEIGLLFANYLLLNAGHNTIYLGSNIPLEDLKHISKHYKKITFLSYFTVKPDDISVEEYISKYQKILKSSAYELWLMGSKIQPLIPSNPKKGIRLIANLQELKTALK